jgi:hypothetical protein
MSLYAFRKRQEFAAFPHKFVLFWSQRIVKAVLRLAVYRQLFHLGAKALETHDERFLFVAEPLW